MLPKFLTVREVLTLLPVGKTTIYALMEEKKIRHVVIKGKKVIPEDALEEFVRANTVSVQEEVVSPEPSRPRPSSKPKGGKVTLLVSPPRSR
jgi:excisionase family DNA binding protein